MAMIDSAYQYYLSTYGVPRVSRYDTHKKSQLRAVYNNIVKTNKESPLYKIKDTGNAKKFAIDIKEHARSIQNVVAALSDEEEGIENAFSQRIAESSDEDSVIAEYVGQDKSADKSFKFNIEVKQLATTQVNLGHYLAPDRYDVKPGSYSFDLATALGSYEFQFNVSSKDTNRTVQEKIVRLINNSNIGLKASVVEDNNGKFALRLESRQTGLGENEDCLFEVMPFPETPSINAMRTLGIDHVEKQAQNSYFLLNGKEGSSLSNTFTVNDAFELTLKKPSEDGTAAQIGFKADADAIADNVQSLVTAYNNIVQLGQVHTDSRQSTRLLTDMSGVAKEYHQELASIGLTLEEDGCLSIDRDQLTKSVTSANAKSSFATLNKFKDSLGEKASSASINPMNYVNKVIVAYKNPGHNFVTPYITSIYSGMMLDQYC